MVQSPSGTIHDNQGPQSRAHDCAESSPRRSWRALPAPHPQSYCPTDRALSSGWASSGSRPPAAAGGATRARSSRAAQRRATVSRGAQRRGPCSPACAAAGVAEVSTMRRSERRCSVGWPAMPAQSCCNHSALTYDLPSQISRAVAPFECLNRAANATIASNECSSALEIRNTPCEVAISGDQWGSVSNQRPSEAIGGHQRPSVRLLSAAIGGNHGPGDQSRPQASRRQNGARAACRARPQ